MGGGLQRNGMLLLLIVPAVEYLLCFWLLLNSTSKGMEDNHRKKNKNEQPATLPDKEDKSEYYYCHYMPYIEGFSERSHKDLKSLKVKVAVNTTKTWFCMVCKLQPK